MSPSELEKKYELRARIVNTWVRNGKLTSTNHGTDKSPRYEVGEADFLTFIYSEAAGKHRKTSAELLNMVSANNGTVLNKRSEATPQQVAALPNKQSNGESDSTAEPSGVAPPQQQSENSAPDLTSSSEPTVHEIDLDRIHIDPDCQVRTQQNKQAVTEYAESMKGGARFPPVELFEDTDTGQFFIGDGYHRIAALSELGRKTATAHIHPGGKSAAIRHALEANQKHGVRLTSADKRRAISIAVKTYDKLSNVEIAKICGVSESSVRNHREKVDPGQKRIGADGKAQAAEKRKPSTYKRAKSAITRVHCTKEDAAKLIDWLTRHYKLKEPEAPKNAA